MAEVVDLSTDQRVLLARIAAACLCADSRGWTWSGDVRQLVEGYLGDHTDDLDVLLELRLITVMGKEEEASPEFRDTGWWSDISTRVTSEGLAVLWGPR